MYLYHIGNHLTAGKTIINTICSLTLTITDICTEVSCSKTAFFCYTLTPSTTRR